MTHPPLKGVTLVVATMSLALATFMNILDTTIANVSIPTIAGNLSVTPSRGTWVITSYAVCVAVVVPLTGWLATRFGEVRLFITCTILFSFASLLCGLAPNFETLIIFRALQGAIAGPMIPLSQTLLLRCYPPEKKGMALALWGMTTVVAPIVGPILGGYLTDNAGWPWIFYINVPVGLVCAYLTWNILKERESQVVKVPVDKIGLALLVIGVISLQMALDQGNQEDWFDSTFIITLSVISFTALVFFLAWEYYEKNPVVDLTLFRSRNFTVATIAISAGYMTFFGGVVIFPLWLQTQMGYAATWAGLASAPIGVLTLILMPVVGANVSKIDLRIITSFAFIVFAITSYWHATFNLDTDFYHLVEPRFIQGIGMACFFVPLTAMALIDLPPDRFASASGVTNFFRMLGGAFGASMAVTIWDRRAIFHHSNLAENVTAYSDVAIEATKNISTLGLSKEAVLKMIDFAVIKQSVMLATCDIFLLSALIFISLIGVVWFSRPTQKMVNGNV